MPADGTAQPRAGGSLRLGPYRRPHPRAVSGGARRAEEGDAGAGEPAVGGRLMAAARALAAGGMVLLTCFLGRPPAVDAGSNAGPSGNPTLFLLTEGRLTAPELDAVARGRIVTKVIETSDRSEVMSFTVMRVKTTPDRVLDRFRSVETWRRYPWVLQAGRVGPVPSPRDLDALTLDGGDIKALARRRVNDCDIRLPPDVIE